jgi:hypothetical protein
MLWGVGCGAEVDDGGDVGDSDADLTASSGGSCDRNKLLGAVSGDRKTVLQRGLSWFDQKVPYSQSKSHEGYRTDCSGFVSMCWDLGTSFTTADFVAGEGDDSLLKSFDDLVPGDAMVRRVGGSGHVVLFAGWQDAKHTSACVVEEESTKLGMQFHVRTASSLKSSSFKPIRADKLADSADSTSGAITPPTQGGSTSKPTPATPSTSGGGQRCASDGACNPGNDGSGLICVSNQCVPGCHTNAQCPGVTTCHSGQCR